MFAFRVDTWDFFSRASGCRESNHVGPISFFIAFLNCGVKPDRAPVGPSPLWGHKAYLKPTLDNQKVCCPVSLFALLLLYLTVTVVIMVTFIRFRLGSHVKLLPVTNQTFHDFAAS